MNLDEWRKKKTEGERFVTPSGLTVRLRRASLLGLAERGRIPAPLVGSVNALLNGRQALTVETVGEFLAVVNLVVSEVLIEPAVTETPGNTNLAVDELSVADRLAIYDWATSELESLRPFREAAGEPG
ncbi:MAG: hypothetical protein AB1453_10370 [Chloroflexota bacterium]